MATVSVNKLLDNIVVGHLNNGRKHGKTLLIDVYIINGIDIREVACGVRTKVNLRVVKVHQAVKFHGHGFWKVNNFLLTLCVRYGDFCLFVVVFLVVYDLSL